MQGCGARLVWLLVLSLAWLGPALGGEEEDGEVLVEEEEEDDVVSDELGEEDGVLVLHEHNFARALSEHRLLLVEFCECPPSAGRGAGREYGGGTGQGHGCGQKQGQGHRQGHGCRTVHGVDVGGAMGTGRGKAMFWGGGQVAGAWDVAGDTGQGHMVGAMGRGTGDTGTGAHQAHAAITCPGHPSSLPLGPGTPQSCPGAVPTTNSAPCPQMHHGVGTASAWPPPLPRQPPR